MSASDTWRIDWDKVSDWCQRYLGLSNSSLDSLWYEHLGEAAHWFRYPKEAKVAISYYKRAIDSDNPSWLCHRELGKAYSLQKTTSEAIKEIELALQEAEREGATPKPEKKDITDLHLLLGDYICADPAEDVQKALQHYLFACNSGDSNQAGQGQLGRLKAMLRFPGEEEATAFVQDILTRESEEGGMLGVLKLIALTEHHGAIFSKIFTVAKGHSDLLQDILRVMETATA